MSADSYLRAKIFLSVQRALIGCVVPEMRFISVEWSEYRIHLHVYIDGLLRDDMDEDFRAAAVTKIIADFPGDERGDPQVCCAFHRCDAPAKPGFEGDLVYGRKEN